MSYIPSTMGQLWNNAGTLSVVSVDQLYNESTTSIDLDAAIPYIEGITSGYIEFKQDKITSYTGVIFSYLSSSSLSGINITVSGGVTSFVYYTNNSNVVVASYDTPSSQSTIRFSFSTSGLVLSIGGVGNELDFTVGDSSTAVEIPASGSQIIFNRQITGFIYDLVISDESNVLVDYTGANDLGTSVYTELVNSANGVVEEWYSPSDLAVQIEKYGYQNIPYWTVNRYIENPPTSIFEDLPIDLSDEPLESEIAFLRYRDTKQPYLPTQLSGNQYPIWDEQVSNLERNPDCWYYKKSMTCFSIWSNLQSFAGHATLLSPRHALVSMHVFDDFDGSPMDGTIARPNALAKQYTFEDMSGNQQTVSGLDYEFIYSSLVLQSDMVVLLLSEEITLDVDYASFFTDSDFASYNYRDVTGCGPTKEGYFCIEDVGQIHVIGLSEPIESQDKFKWSRYNNPSNDVDRVGDSSSPYFIYNGDTLYFVAIASTKTSYPYTINGECVANFIPDSWNDATRKAGIETAMDALDLRNGGLPNYNLVEVAI